MTRESLKKNLMLFLFFGGLIFIFSFAIYPISSFLSGFIALILPVFMVALLVLIMLGKVKRLEDIQNKNLDFSYVIMTLGGYLYLASFLNLLGLVYDGELWNSYLNIAGRTVAFMFYLVLLYFVCRIVLKKITKEEG
jgi:dihydrodipicolinate synthase/N-acetylneuraminate lyase